MPKVRTYSTSEGIFRTLRYREMGIRPPLGWENQLSSTLYYNIVPHKFWLHGHERSSHGMHGGVFNLEFSPEGSLLVAACERKSILIFDPHTRKMVKCIEKAHEDCVNCVKFLDTRMFATCSDDTTVALWDARNTKSKIRSLHGHSNWVKNIEFSKRENLLVTSGFDGSIYTWDINSYTEKGLVYNRVFNTSGLMRTRLNHDGSKMVMCTTAGYIVVIHDLNLGTLGHDLLGFKPNTYRLMQLSNSTIPAAAHYTHLFTSKVNRVELITDFPEENEAEVISSLQVHPHGWCILSRNTSTDDNSEWTCVHDIQDLPKRNEEEMETEDQSNPRSSDPLTRSPDQSAEGTRNEENADSAVMQVQLHFSPSTSQVRNESAESVDNNNRNEPSAPTLANLEIHFSAANNVMEIFDAIREARARREARRATENIAGAAREWDLGLGLGNGNRPNRAGRRQTAYLVSTPSTSGEVRTVLFMGSHSHMARQRHVVPQGHQIHSNDPRLLCYLEEPNVGKGFIKELCFSSDGRLIFSPYENGIRILSFDSDCSELSTCVPGTPTKLHEISRTMCHNNVVVSTKFSPTHCFLVSGCLNGRVVWHQPMFL